MVWLLIAVLFGYRGVFIFLLSGVVSVGCIGEIICHVVLGIVSTISSFIKCDWVWISWWSDF